MENDPRVSAEVYEELKMLSAMRDVCVLAFRPDTGGEVTVHTKILDVFRDEDGAFLLAENGLTLQLHQLVAINGKPLETFC